MRYPPTELIKARTLAEAWGQAVPYVLENGMVIGTQYGNRSRDACVVIEIRYPFEQPMLHPQFPTKELHMNEYLKKWERDYGWIKQGFEYNYMDRLIYYPKSRIECDKDILEKQERIKDRIGVVPYYYNYAPPGDINFNPKDMDFIDQIARIREELPKGVSRRLEAITWIPGRDLFVKEDQPCLQRLWFRYLGDGFVEMHCMWRSRDLYAAWNSNMVGLLTMVKREILDPNNLKLVKVVDFDNSLHIYEADWDAASKVKPAIVSPQLR